MPSCYFCGCALNNGEGFRRKVLTGESARIYVSKRGGGSYGQTYSLRTLCRSCAEQLDERNKNLNWILPVSCVVGLIGALLAVRWAVSSDSSASSFGGLIFLFFLVGGAGFITFFALNYLVAQGKSAHSINDQPKLETDEQSDVAGAQYSFQHPEHHDLLVKKALEMDEYGIHFGGCYSKQDEELGSFEIYERVLKLMPPKQFPDKEKWIQLLEKSTYKKFLELIEIPERKLWAFPEIEGEDAENYSVRLNNAIAIAREKI